MFVKVISSSSGIYIFQEKYYFILNCIIIQVRQHERLFGVLLAHEVETAASGASSGAEGDSGPAWEGELCGPAQTLLHQHAIQGDMSALQATVARFAAACRLNSDAPLDPK